MSEKRPLTSLFKDSLQRQEAKNRAEWKAWQAHGRDTEIFRESTATVPADRHLISALCPVFGTVAAFAVIYGVLCIENGGLVTPFQGAEKVAVIQPQ